MATVTMKDGTGYRCIAHDRRGMAIDPALGRQRNGHYAETGDLRVSEGVRDSFWLQGMQAGFKNALDCIKAFSETDFTDDLE